MFCQGYSALISRLHADSIVPPRPSGSRAANLESDVLRAMNRETVFMKYSERLKNPSEYRRLRQSCRSSLEALLTAPFSAAVAERAADLICAITEESTWSADGISFDEENHPPLDLFAAETAVLLAWTYRAMGASLRSDIARHIRDEVRRRALRPVAAHDDYPFMRGDGACPLTVAADLLLCALLMEEDEARLSRVVKPLLRILDENCGRHGRTNVPLGESVADIAAVTDLIALLRRATRGAFDLTQQLPADEWLDEILFARLQDGVFLDPAGEGLTDRLSGGDIFRVGLAVGDDALTALGALVYRVHHLPSATVTGRLAEAGIFSMLEAETRRPPLLRYAATRRNLLMVSRMSGMTCALHTGGSRGNAGDLCLFADRMPVFTDGGASIQVRSLPTLGGHMQMNAPDVPCPADFDVREDREALSVELTNAYPPESNLQSYQRTLLVLRNEETLRLVDAMSFHTPTEVEFSFLCGAMPVARENGLRVGAVRMTWEDDFILRIQRLTDDLTRLVLTARKPVTQAIFSFNFEKQVI